MDYALEVGLEKEDSRRFLMSLEKQLEEFLDSREFQKIFTNLNPYERLLLHKTAQRFQMSTSTLEPVDYSQECKSGLNNRKFTQKFEGQNSAKERNVKVFKTEYSIYPFIAYSQLFEVYNDRTHFITEQTKKPHHWTRAVKHGNEKYHSTTDNKNIKLGHKGRGEAKWHIIAPLYTKNYYSKPLQCGPPISGSEKEIDTICKGLEENIDNLETNKEDLKESGERGLNGALFLRSIKCIKRQNNTKEQSTISNPKIKKNNNKNYIENADVQGAIPSPKIERNIQESPNKSEREGDNEHLRNIQEREYKVKEESKEVSNRQPSQRPITTSSRFYAKTGILDQTISLKHIVEIYSIDPFISQFDLQSQIDRNIQMHVILREIEHSHYIGIFNNSESADYFIRLYQGKETAGFSVRLLSNSPSPFRALGEKATERKHKKYEPNIHAAKRLIFGHLKPTLAEQKLKTPQQ